jgi:hypothetical protein
MDCEKFDSLMIDELYGELDELTSAAAKRHLAGCARCAARLEGLKATRRLAAVSLASEPAGLEERILAAAERILPPPTARPRWAHAISLAGSWAMRPQTAMAAVFLVMIGTSVLLLRGKSARAPLGDGVTVTEQGTPAPAAPPDLVRTPAEPSPVAATSFAQAPAEERAASAVPRSVKGAPQLAARGAADSLSFNPDRDDAPDERFHSALRSYRAGRFDDAARAFESLPSSDPNAPDLWAARSVRDGKGCRAAVVRFDKAAAHHRRTTAGADALLEGALCYRALGEASAARARLTPLLDVDSHRDRARAELDQLEELQQASGAESESASPVKSAARARAAAPAAPAAMPPAAAAESPASAPAPEPVPASAPASPPADVSGSAKSR